ncbi:MAG: sulfite exporter TauE/SafE family protein [Firmicutes bacterium]|nr:sulfite exporter TauE/SafE family protein [Bacillota bacterium]
MEESRKTTFKTVALSLGAGILIGFANGFFGGGGGMICVPLLLLIGLSTKRAHATAMLVILPVSIASGIIYITKGFFDLNTMLYVLAGCIAGGIIGAVLLKKLNVLVTQYLFALVVIAAGIRIVFF